MTTQSLIDPELRERVKELTERLEPAEGCLVRQDGPAIDFEVGWVIRTYCSCRTCGQWFQQVTLYVAEVAGSTPRRPMRHALCTWCGKTISAEQTLLAGDRPYCVDCVMTAAADSDHVDVSVDMLRRLRDGILY